MNVKVFTRSKLLINEMVKRTMYRYIAGTEKEVWAMIEGGCRTLCEVIDLRKSCHLHVDIDVDLKNTWYFSDGVLGAGTSYHVGPF